ncbi:trimeric intracellular cation channel family protein [Corynebacterium zhongnanshanii]
MMLSVLYVIGITAEAMTAALAAGRQRMDIFGVMMIAAVTAFGGGVVRDVLLDHYPMRWVAEPIYLMIVLAAALLTVLASFLMDYFRTIFLVLDAIGLSAFSVLGTQVAMSLGHGLLIAIVAAVVTGVFGGILRDIFCDRVPLVFSEELYASVAIVAACLYFGLVTFTGSTQLAVMVTLVVAIVLRLLAIYYNISLPVFEYQDKEYQRDPAGRLTLWVLNKAGVRRRVRKKRTITNRRENRRDRGE